MAFVNLKDLKANIGGQLRLTLNSSGVYEEKEWDNKKFNVFKYEVIQDNQVMTLDATDSLHRKLMTISKGDDFLLSWEQFTTNEGQLRNYWKVEKCKGKDNPVFENVKKSVNEFDQKLKADKAVKEAVQTTNATYTNGARFGMVFNNCIKLYIENGMKWTTPEFVANFKRVESWVEACEAKPGSPQDIDYLEQKQRVDDYKQNVIDNTTEPVQIDEDELPF